MVTAVISRPFFFQECCDRRAHTSHWTIDATACPHLRGEMSSETGPIPAGPIPASVVKDYARYLGGSLSCRARLRPRAPGPLLRGGPVTRSQAAGQYGASLRRAGRLRWSAGRVCPWLWDALCPWHRLSPSRSAAAAAQRADGSAPCRLDSDRMQSAEPCVYARAIGRPAARHHRHAGGASFHRGPGTVRPYRLSLRV